MTNVWSVWRRFGIGLSACGLLVATAAQATTLSDAAASLQPGQSAQLSTSGFNGNLLGTGSSDVLVFAMNMKWDPQRRELHFIGAPHYERPRHIVYSESSNSWSERSVPSGIGIPMHGYDHLTIDPAGRRLYHRLYNSGTLIRYDLDSQSSTRSADNTLSPLQVAGAIEWFPEIGRVVLLDGDFGVYLYDPAGNSWTQSSGKLSGTASYHNFAEYSPVHRVLIMGGGDNSRAVYRMNSSRAVSRAVDAPTDLGIHAGIVTVDPVSGHFLVFSGGGAYQYDPVANAWTALSIVQPWISGSSTVSVVAASLSSHGVVLLAKYDGENSRVWLYKHRASSSTPGPAVTLSANPTSVNTQGSTTLTWSATDATSCTASATPSLSGWSGSKATSGSETVGPLSASTTFGLSCSNSGGGVGSQSVTVSIISSTPAPTVTFTANPSSVAMNGSSTLSWTTTNATSCTGSGGLSGWSGAKQVPNGSQSVGPLSAASTFTLSCTGAGGTTQRTVTVALLSAPSVSFGANPTAVNSGASSTLTWSSQNTTGCSASGAWAGNKATSGSEQTGGLSATSTFNLSCTGAGGTTQKTVTVTVGAAPTPAPTVDLTADPTAVAVNGSTTLSWSTTNATSCTASGGWSGTKGTSGTESTGSLSNTASYGLSCTGAGGIANDSVTVTVTAGGGGAGPGTESDGGGGSLGLWSLIALVFVLLRRSAATLMPRRVMSVLAGALLSFGGGAMADALSDYQQRASHPDVVRAVSFDGAGDVNNHVLPDGNFERSGSGWDQTVKASGAGSLRFTVPSNSGSGGSGSWRINFSDAPFNVQFGANEEFYVQWRQRFDSGLLTTDFQGGGGWKQVIIGEGDVSTITEAGSCSELEIVVQNTDERGFPQMYHACGYYTPFEQLFGAFDFKLQNAIPAPYCLYSLNPSGQITGKEPCFLYRANEWMTFQVRVKLGPRGTGSSAIGGSGIPGFINSTVQMWIAREGQPAQLVHDWSGLVLRESEGKEYGKIWLLPYHTGKSSSQSHPVTYTWYDELIVSRSRIADPAPSGVTNPTISFSANPTSVSAQGTTQVTWSTTAADACTASASPAFGGWSGSKPTSGNAALGPLSATTSFTLACTNTGGGSASRTATVAVASATPAPAVTFSANPTSVAMNGSSTLSWSTSNATSCTGGGSWSGAKQVNGSQSVGPLSAASTYTLSCTGAGGTTQKSVTVSLISAPAVSFSANPTSVTVGERSTLTWSSQNATGCSASGAWAGNKAASGSEQTGTLNNTSTFTLDCSGSGGSTSGSVTVTAVAGGGGNPPPAPPAPEQSGGGSLGLWSLIALVASALRRRWRRRGFAAAVS